MSPGKTFQPRRFDLPREAIGRLRRVESDSRVLSLYLDFDPAQAPNLRERATQADALLADAQRRWGDGSASREERMALREEIEAVRGLFTDERELAPESARGLAVFCSARAGLFDVVNLPEPVGAIVAVAERPFIEPLLEFASPERWCVMLVSHRASRIFTGTRDRLVERAHLHDEVHRHHEQGGWSQSRYQRGVETETDRHIRATGRLLLERSKLQPFTGVLLAGPHELHHRVEHELDRRVREQVVGSFEIDVERASADEVRRRALPLIEDAERDREDGTLDRLEEGLGPGGHGAVGLDEVLEALNERRVDTLVVSSGFATPGFACPSCERLSVGARRCPLDGAVAQERDDIVESAVERALADAAHVLVVRHERERLAEHGSVAALLRF